MEINSTSVFTSSALSTNSSAKSIEETSFKVSLQLGHFSLRLSASACVLTVMSFSYPQPEQVNIPPF